MISIQFRSGTERNYFCNYCTIGEVVREFSVNVMLHIPFMIDQSKDGFGGFFGHCPGYKDTR